MLVCFLVLSTLLAGAKPNKIKNHQKMPANHTPKSAFSRLMYEPKIYSSVHLSTRSEPINIDNLKTAIAGSADFMEGDIKIPPEFRNNDKKSKRTITQSRTSLRWVNNIIPYQIDQNGFNLFTQARIRTSMDLIESRTDSCITFRPRIPSDATYLNIVNSDGCWSYVGSLFNLYPQFASQDLSLQENIFGNCSYMGTIVHELLHASGAFHEQTRPDRDDYINVVFENIRADAYAQFAKNDIGTTHGIDYDYYSIMHYGGRTFSMNGGRTIIPNDPSVILLESYQKTDDKIMTLSDALAVKKYYGCPIDSSTSSTITTTPSTSLSSAPSVKEFFFRITNDLKGYSLYLYEDIGGGLIQYRLTDTEKNTIEIASKLKKLWVIYTDDFVYYSYLYVGFGRFNIEGATTKAFDLDWYFV